MKLRLDQILGSLALLIALLGLWRWWHAPEIESLAKNGLSTAVFKASDVPRADELAAVWTEPEAQSAGREWIFEVFTPPIIYFDQTSQRFTLLPPLEPAEKPSFGVKLLAINEQPYRLQYAGHHGVEGAYIVEIRDHESGRFYRGRPGITFDKGDFALREFRAERVVIQPAKANRTPYIERSVRLLVDDFRSNETVELGRDALILPDPVIVLETDGGQRSEELHPGDEWAFGDSLYRVVSIAMDIGQATIARLGADGSIETEESLTLVGATTESEM